MGRAHEAFVLWVRLFDSVDDLKEALWYEWDNLDLKLIRDLIKSMPDRIDELKRKRG